MKYLFIDTETTGLNPKRHGLIQAAGIIEINGREEASFSFRIKPFPGDQIEESALKVNQISREAMMSYPDPQTVFAELNTLLQKYSQNGKLHFVAYNARFDWDFVSEFFYKNSRSSLSNLCYFPPLDVMSLAAEALKEQRHALKDFKLATVARAMGVEIEKKALHEAFYDVKVARELYRKITGLKVSLSPDTLF